MNKKAIIIDDTKNICLMLKKCLELEGYEVSTADNGSDGLALALNQKANIIFLDIKLPEISGTEVLRRMRAKGVFTPVIIITAYPTIKNAVTCTQLGAITYLQKPFTADRLHNILKEFNLDHSSFTDDEVTYSDIENLIEKEDFAIAFSKIKTFLSSEPGNSQAYNLLGKLYEKLGNPEMSDKFFKTEEIFKKNI